MLPDCVGVWSPSWIKSESLNRKYLSFCFLTILQLKKKQKANCGDKQKEI